MKSILVLSDEEKCWLEPFWLKVFEQQQDSFRLVKIVTVPGKLTNLSPFQAKLWFLKNFGITQTTLLQLFYLVRILRYSLMNRRNLKRRSFQNLILRLPDFDKDRIHVIVDKIKPDVVFITTSHIIPKELLVTPSTIWLNKHASLLPRARGIFPFFWSTLFDLPLGYSIHIVSEEVDAGRIIFQEPIPSHTSMTHFYHTVFSRFSVNFNLIMASDLVDYEIPQNSSNSSSFSLPKKDEIQRWRRLGFKVIELKDFITSIS